MERGKMTFTLYSMPINRFSVEEREKKKKNTQQTELLLLSCGKRKLAITSKSNDARINILNRLVSIIWSNRLMRVACILIQEHI